MRVWPGIPTDLRDGNDVHGVVELAIACAKEAVAYHTSPEETLDRGDADVGGEGVGGSEPADRSRLMGPVRANSLAATPAPTPYTVAAARPRRLAGGRSRQGGKAEFG